MTDVTRMVSLYQDGLPLRRVAEAIGCSQSCVYSHLKRRGVEIRGSGGGGGARSNPIVCGRKFCSGCGRWRHIVDFSASRRTPNVQIASQCHTCVRISDRERRRDPVRGALRREYERIWREVERRNAGVQPRVWGPTSKRQEVTDLGGNRRSLDPRPLAGIIEQWSRLHGASNDNGAQEVLATRAGVSDRRIRAIVNHERYGGRVAIATADRICLALGLHIDLVYPEAGIDG